MQVNNIKDLKKYQNARRVSSHVTNLVIGKNLWALVLTDKLKQKFGEDQVKLLGTGELTLKELDFFGPSLLRGEANIEIYKKIFETAELTLDSTLLYKDQKLKKVQPNSVITGLKESEAYFLQPSVRVDRELLIEKKLPQLLEENKEQYLNYSISSLKRVQENSQVNWLVNCEDGSQFSCTNLFFTLSPHYLVNFIKEKDSLTLEFQEWAMRHVGPMSLEISFSSNRKITELKETLLVPQSQTYEWGHFIGMFEEWNEIEKNQRFNFFTFIDEENSDHEDIAKKVRLLKKNLERVFPELEKAKISEVISLKKEGPWIRTGENIFNSEKLESELPHCYIVGPNSPLKSMFSEENLQFLEKNVSHDLRAYISIRQTISALS